MRLCKRNIVVFLTFGLNILLAQSPSLLGENYNWRGKVFPNIHYTDLSGKSQSLDNINTDIVLLDFWYIACQPCLKAFPYIDDLQQKYKNDQKFKLK